MKIIISTLIGLVFTLSALAETGVNLSDPNLRMRSDGQYVGSGIRVKNTVNGDEVASNSEEGCCMGNLTDAGMRDKTAIIEAKTPQTDEQKGQDGG